MSYLPAVQTEDTLQPKERHHTGATADSPSGRQGSSAESVSRQVPPLSGLSSQTCPQPPSEPSMYLKNCFHSVTFLRDSSYVTRFQKFFGLTILPDGEASEKAHDKANGVGHGSVTQQATKYRIDNYFWFYLFSFGSKLGYELFYSLSFSYCYWNLDSFVCRRLMLVWAILMYTGQSLKEIIQWPRPQGPNVLILEPAYSLEYGMPSTHAILALSIPVNLFTILLSRYEFSISIYCLCALAWCSLICCSRLYLGMHSVLDILAGLTLTGVLLIPLLPSVNRVDYYLLLNWSSPFVLLFLVIFFALVYPKSNNGSPSRGDTCVMIGATAGVYLGSWLHYQLGIIGFVAQSTLFVIAFPSGESVLNLLIRTLLGLLIIALFRFVGKATITHILKYLFAIDAKDPKRKFQTSVEVPTKLFTYLMVGFALAFVAPVTFAFLHIDRVSLYTEA